MYYIGIYINEYNLQIKGKNVIKICFMNTGNSIYSYFFSYLHSRWSVQLNINNSDIKVLIVYSFCLWVKLSVIVIATLNISIDNYLKILSNSYN